MHITRHAIGRWRQRVGLPLALLEPGLAGSVDVPGRLVGPLVAPKWRNRRDPKARGTSYRLSASAIYVVSRRRVVTVVALGVDDLAALLVWTMTRQWV